LKLSQIVDDIWTLCVLETHLVA